MINLTQCALCESSNIHIHLTTKDHSTTGEQFAVQRCSDCGFLQTNPQPDEEEIGKYYQSPDYISHTSKANSLVDRIYLLARTFTLSQKIKLLRKYSTGKTLLDYGCGTGAFLAHAKKAQYAVHGIEPSESPRILANNLVGGTVVSSLPQLKDQKFDIITLWHVLEHIHDFKDILLHLKDKTNDLVIVAVPNPNSWDSKHYKSIWAAWDTPRHLWHFTPTTAQKLFHETGLKQIAIEPLRLDSFYVSLLSEKYKHQNQLRLTGITRAAINGAISNYKAIRNGQYSSLIYVLKK
jgi:2-polyprenyl-3-methyl-5-hydroxy-6-metoxy-1,4-benzoquinol methylase